VTGESVNPTSGLPTLAMEWRRGPISAG
jgi:hypothetical protein